MQIHVILRTCSNSLLTPSEGQRVCGPNRELMLRKCFYSLVRTIETSGLNVHLTILDDHSDSTYLDFIKTTSKGLQCEFLHLEQRGPQYSALKQFETAKTSPGLVYVVEDDYLHELNALTFMVGAYTYFLKRYNKPTVIYPYDCSLRYAHDKEATTVLYHDGVRYWREVDKTAFTMFTHSSTIQSHWSTFQNASSSYPQILEDETINLLYYSPNQPHAPVRAFNPIPSVAYHLGYSEIPSINTDHTHWKQLWNQIPTWNLIQGWFYHPEFFAQVVKSLPENSKIVEIGAWRGKSTCCLATLIKESGKSISLYVVDTWEGSDEPEHKKIISDLSVNLYDDFLSNMTMCEISDILTPIKKSSVEASKLFLDKSLDFVMIDGDHSYQAVKADILSWLPKLKPGGLLAGDDYEWPGVKQAVHEIFEGRFQFFGSAWCVFV